MSHVHFLDVFEPARLPAGLSDREAAEQARSLRLGAPSPRLLALLTRVRQQLPGITVSVVGGKDQQPVEWVEGDPPRIRGEGATCVLWTLVLLVDVDVRQLEQGVPQVVVWAKTQGLGVWDEVTELCRFDASLMIRFLGDTADANDARALSTNRRWLVESKDTHSRFLDLASGVRSQAFRWHRRHVNAHAFSSDGALVLSGSDDLTAAITRTSSGQRVRTLGGTGKRLHTELAFGYESALYRIFNPDGPGPISNLSKRIGIVERIARSICRAILRALRWHDQPVKCVALSPDGREALTGDSDGTVRIWSVASGRLLRRLENPSQLRVAYHVGYSPDGTAVLAASMRCVMVWDRASGRERHCLHVRDHIRSAVFAGGPGRILVSTGEIAVLWDITDKEPAVVQTFEFERGSTVFCATESEDGNYVVTSSWDRNKNVRLSLWDAKSGSLIRVLVTHSAHTIRLVAFEDSATQIIAVADDGTVFRWNCASNTCQIIWKVPIGESGNGISCSGTWQTVRLDANVPEFSCAMLQPYSLRIFNPGADDKAFAEIFAKSPSPALLEAPVNSRQMIGALRVRDALHTFGDIRLRRLMEIGFQDQLEVPVVGNIFLIEPKAFSACLHQVIRGEGGCLNMDAVEKFFFNGRPMQYKYSARLERLIVQMLQVFPFEAYGPSLWGGRNPLTKPVFKKDGVRKIHVNPGQIDVLLNQLMPAAGELRLAVIVPSRNLYLDREVAEPVQLLHTYDADWQKHVLPTEQRNALIEETLQNVLGLSGFTLSARNVNSITFTRSLLADELRQTIIYNFRACELRCSVQSSRYKSILQKIGVACEWSDSGVFFTALDLLRHREDPGSDKVGDEILTRNMIAWMKEDVVRLVKPRLDGMQTAADLFSKEWCFKNYSPDFMPGFSDVPRLQSWIANRSNRLGGLHRGIYAARCLPNETFKPIAVAWLESLKYHSQPADMKDAKFVEALLDLPQTPMDSPL